MPLSALKHRVTDKFKILFAEVCLTLFYFSLCIVLIVFLYHLQPNFILKFKYIILMISNESVNIETSKYYQIIYAYIVLYCASVYLFIYTPTLYIYLFTYYLASTFPYHHINFIRIHLFNIDSVLLRRPLLIII